MKKDKFLDKYYENIKDHDDEHFKFITYPNVKNKYIISNYGKIINFASDKILKPRTDKDGYLRITLVPKTKTGPKNVYAGVHRLVAWEFCKKPDGCDIVNHLDANVQNNYYKNLEWTTVKGNTQHAIKMGLTIRSGCNTSSSTYSQDTIYTIINLLKEGNNTYQVYKYFYPHEERSKHPEFYKLIYAILHKTTHEVDTKGIEFPKEAFESTMKRKWTDDEVDELKDMINEGMSNREIVNYYGFDNTESEGARRYTDKLKELRTELGIKSYNPYIDANNKIKQLV